MFRLLYGLSVDDYTLISDEFLSLSPNTAVTFYESNTSVTPVEDILDADGLPIATIVSDEFGMIPVFQGPLNSTEPLWIEIDGNPARYKLVPNMFVVYADTEYGQVVADIGSVDDLEEAITALEEMEDDYNDALSDANDLSEEMDGVEEDLDTLEQGPRPGELVFWAQALETNIANTNVPIPINIASPTINKLSAGVSGNQITFPAGKYLIYGLVSMGPSGSSTSRRAAVFTKNGSDINGGWTVFPVNMNQASYVPTGKTYFESNGTDILRMCAVQNGSTNPVTVLVDQDNASFIAAKYLGPL
jgi:hypothetical protein